MYVVRIYIYIYIHIHIALAYKQQPPWRRVFFLFKTCVYNNISGDRFPTNNERTVVSLYRKLIIQEMTLSSY